MPERFAIRITEDLLNMAAQLTGSEATDAFDDIPYIVCTPLSPTKFNLELMSEDQMFVEFKDNSNLHILN